MSGKESLREGRQRRVVEAARAWRRAYQAWLHDETKYDESGGSVRDMRKNGENLALSHLLNALQALDEVERGDV